MDECVCTKHCLTPIVRSQHKPPVECRYAAGHTGREDDQDFTGDSGFSASTKYFDDSDPYCVVDLWRRPLPPTPPAAAREKGIFNI